MIRLHRNLSIHAFDVEGVVSRSQERPELLAVVRLAHDLPGGITPEVLANELIGSQPVLCRRIIDRCVALNLLDCPQRGPAQLSELGREMLRRGEILIPEQGGWRVYYTDDPLIDVAVVHVAALPGTNARDERSELHRKKGTRREQAVPRPRVVGDLSGKLCTSIVDGSTFQLLDIAKQGAGGPTSDVRLDIEYLPSAEPRVTLRGPLQAPGGPLDHTLAKPRALTQWSYDELWTELVSIADDLKIETLEAACQWAGKRVLPISFEPTSETERRQLACDLEVPNTKFRDLGDFQPTRLEAVELIPRSTEDAACWARWLQWDELRSYQIPAQLREATTRIAARFPLFKVVLRSPAELLAHAKTEPNSPRARTLLTPADLGLWS